MRTRPPATGALRAALGTIVAASAAPYGYTISIWSSGAMLMHTHGTPNAGEIFAFLAGALCAYGLTSLLARGGLRGTDSLDCAPDRVLAGAMHWLAAGTAVGSAALVAMIRGWEAWPRASFTATAIYILRATLQLAVVTTRSGRVTR